MKLSTRKFGGLGIVINVQDGVLTVVRPIEDTPADRAGIQVGDKIVQIGLDSTVNMTLDEAVDLLRGEPNTRVAIWVERKGWTTPRRFLLRRANVKVKSIAYRLLKNRIGLIRIHNFQSTTISELKRAMTRLKGQAGRSLKGLVLDLRGNPGGLLDRRKSSGSFCAVWAVGYNCGPWFQNARTQDGDPCGDHHAVTMVVLIDGSSASASEIVAGSLKNHNRALVVGERSFGKGSVQVIYDNRDDSALKLTIAQYLTPGGISIQSVGIVPDIRVRGLFIDPDDEGIDIFEGPCRGEDP